MGITAPRFAGRLRLFAPQKNHFALLKTGSAALIFFAVRKEEPKGDLL